MCCQNPFSAVLRTVELANEVARTGVGDPAPVVCPSCRTAVLPTYTWCPQCGMALKPFPCEYCGQPVEPERTTCAHCGAPQSNPAIHSSKRR